MFKLTPAGKLTVLHSFCVPSKADCSDGYNPYAGLVQGTDGKSVIRRTPHCDSRHTIATLTRSNTGEHLTRRPQNLARAPLVYRFACADGPIWSCVP